MIKEAKQLNAVATKTASQWIDRANRDSVNRRNIKRAQLFALELMEYMEVKGIKQVELADRMDVSPQQVNKILRAKSNLTFETLDKIAEALGVTISPPKIIRFEYSYTQNTNTLMQVVHRHKQKTVEDDLKTPTILRKNPILHTTMENMKAYEHTAVQI